MRGCLGNALKIGLGSLVLVIAAASFTHSGRVAVKSARFMVEVFPSAPAYPLRWLADEPEQSEVHYRAGGARTVADLYRPAGGGRHGAMVFYIGVGPERRNPDVVRVAKGLARAGITVMAPVSSNLTVPGRARGKG